MVKAAIRSVGGNLDVSKVTVTNSNGKVFDISNEGGSTELDFIKAGESINIETTLKIAADAEPFNQHTIQSVLSIEHPDPARAGTIYPVQRQGHTVTVAQQFQMSANPGILLVINSETTKDEIDGWKSVCSAVGLEVDTWDASYYGALPLLEGQNGQRALAEGYETIVIFDNNWRSAAGAEAQRIRNTDLMRKSEFIKTAGSYGVNVMVVGSKNSTESILNRFYFPTSGRSWTPSPFSSVQAFFKVFLDKLEDGNFKGALIDSVNEIYTEIEVGGWQFWGKPTSDYLVRTTDKLFQKLKSVAPNQQYVVAYDYEPTQTNKLFWGLFKKYDYGTIQVRRTLGRDLGIAVSLSAEEKNMHTAGFAKSEKNLLAFFTSLSETQRTDIFVKAISNNMFAEKLIKAGLQEPLMRAVLADIALKQSKIRHQSSITKKTIAESLGVVNKIKAEVAIEGTLGDASRGILASFVGEMNALASTQVSWWHYLVPFSDQRQVSRFLRRTSYEILEKASAHKADYKKLKFEVDQIRKKVIEKLGKGGEEGLSTKALKRYLFPMRNTDMMFGEAFESEGSILKVSELAQKAAQDKAREDALKSIEDLLKAERCDLTSGGF